MEQAKLNKILEEHKLWLKTSGEQGKKANLRYADLSYANLSSANLSSADLRYANLDYSAFPLWCGGLDVHIDDKQATQLLYHFMRNVQYSKNTSKTLKKICRIKSLIKQANQFHRVNECGEIKELVGDNNV